MAQRVHEEGRMTIKTLHEKGLAKVRIAGLLGVTEGDVRYHLRRMASGAKDGRARQPHRARSQQLVIEAWLEGQDRTGPLNLAALHEHLVAEHGYEGSLRSIERYFGACYPAPKKWARRRVETPPGAQAQVDWGEFPGVWVAGRRRDLHGFRSVLSYSRKGAVVWSERKDQLAWHRCHNESFRRHKGVAAIIRIDNEKTGVSRGAGAWGEINPAYARYARVVRFHVDACPPRSPHYKGKVERQIRGQREWADPTRQHWNSMDELQEWSDEQEDKSARRRICPQTGTSVQEAWEREQEALAPLPVLPEPFDLVRQNKVGQDCMVSFEGRQYSVPFAFIGQRVEVRGCASTVQILKDASIVATHARHTPERVLIDPRHFEGEATDRVLPPPPLGRLGRRLMEIAQMAPQTRPLDLYAACAEAAR